MHAVVAGRTLFHPGVKMNGREETVLSSDRDGTTDIMLHAASDGTNSSLVAKIFVDTRHTVITYMYHMCWNSK